MKATLAKKKIPWKKILKEVIASDRSSHFLCDNSPTFKGLWDNPNDLETQAEYRTIIYARAKEFVRKRRLDVEVTEGLSKDNGTGDVLFALNSFQLRVQFICFFADVDPLTFETEV